MKINSFVILFLLIFHNSAIFSQQYIASCRTQITDLGNDLVKGSQNSYEVNSMSLISTVLGEYFIKGVSPVMDEITASNPDAYYIDFYLFDRYTNIVYDSSYDNTGGNSSRSWIYDMGVLDTAWVFRAKFYDVNGIFLDSINYWPFILAPDWVNNPFNGTINITSINASAQTIDLNCTLPISAMDFNNTVSSVKGIGGKSFSLNDVILNFNTTFEMATGFSTPANPELSLFMGALSSSIPYFNDASPYSTDIVFDSNFNLEFDDFSTWQPYSFDKSFEFNNVPLVGFDAGNIFSVGGLCVSTNLKFNLNPKIKSQVVMGYDQSNQQWGFIQNGSDVTKLLGKVNASASTQGELKIACASIFGLNMGIGTIARGRIDAQLNIGGGNDYLTYSLPTSQSFWGGSLSIFASGQIAGFDQRSGSYLSQWGDTNAINFRSQSSFHDDFLNIIATTHQVGSDFIPQAWPMGVMSARDSLLSVVWIDDLNAASGKNLMLTYYDPYVNSFTAPCIVANNDSVIETPSVGLMPSHRSLITWSQLNIPKSQIDTVNSSIDDLVKKQDVWIAIYDNISNSIISRIKIPDNSGNRPDGTPKIHWGASNKGLITWQVGDTTNLGSKIYFIEITEIGNAYSFSTPSAITNLNGYNYDVQLSYYDANNAVAEWINDPDMDDSTNNSQVYFSDWNGINWSPESIRYNIMPDTRLKAIALAVNGVYGVDGITYEYYNSDSTLINGLFVSHWNGSNPTSSTQTDLLEDSLFSFQLPRAALSQNGIASFIYQTRNLTQIDDYGTLDLYMNDLNSSVGWQYAASSQYVGDSTEFVWDMSSVFGFLQSANSNNIMYLFSQEIDTLGNTNPSYGRVFGHPNLNLVLRAIDVSSTSGNISFAPVLVPSDSSIITFYQQLNSFNNNFELKQNFPNPFIDITTIPFHVSKSGKVKLDVFDLHGRLVATILNKDLTVGDYETQFNSGILENGVYYYRMNLNGFSTTRKMVIMK